MSGIILLVHPQKYGDDRGWFMESYSINRFKKIGIDYSFVQDNHSLTTSKWTIRGLHFQTSPFAQAKLIRCVRGRIFDVAVDIRKHSPTYGNWIGVELSAENADQLLIPVGFAHGFVTLEQNTEVIYKVSDVYSPANDSGIIWNDDNIGIDWPLPAGIKPILSSKDTQQPRFDAFDSCFTYNGEPMKLLEV